MPSKNIIVIIIVIINIRFSLPPSYPLLFATGVSAAFDAPATGALFAVEFVLKSSRLGLDRLSTSTVFAATSVAAGTVGFLRMEGKALGITGAATHLVGRIPYFSIQPNLLIDVLEVRKRGMPGFPGNYCVALVWGVL